jgi:hypothetical protein
MRVATGSTKKRGQKKRIQCPACLGAYMQQAYIMIQENGKRNWITIGKYCPACRHYIPEKA